MKRVHLVVSGRVQGVFYRHNTNIYANKLGVTGFVRNMSDGNVEVVAEGDDDKIKELKEEERTNTEKRLAHVRKLH